MRLDPAFWLPTEIAKFYPDLVVQLENRRLLAVEYMFARFAEGSDLPEKQADGEMWERDSAETGLPVLAERPCSEKGMRAQPFGRVGL